MPKTDQFPKVVLAKVTMPDGRKMVVNENFQLVPMPDMRKYKNSVLFPCADVETD